MSLLIFADQKVTLFSLIELKDIKSNKYLHASKRQTNISEAESADHLLPDTVFVKENTSRFKDFQLCCLSN